MVVNLCSRLSRHPSLLVFLPPASTLYSCGLLQSIPTTPLASGGSLPVSLPCLMFLVVLTLSVHACTAAVIQATALIRAPTCMMYHDIRNDFDLSFRVISDLAPDSQVAKRALPILEYLRDLLQTRPGSSDVFQLPMYAKKDFPAEL